MADSQVRGCSRQGTVYDDARSNVTIVENKTDAGVQIAEVDRGGSRDFKPREVPSEGSDACLPP